MEDPPLLFSGPCWFNTDLCSPLTLRRHTDSGHTLLCASPNFGCHFSTCQLRGPSLTAPFSFRFALFHQFQAGKSAKNGRKRPLFERSCYYASSIWIEPQRSNPESNSSISPQGVVTGESRRLRTHSAWDRQRAEVCTSASLRGSINYMRWRRWKSLEAPCFGLTRRGPPL